MFKYGIEINKMYVYQEKFFFLTCEKNERNDRIF